MKPLIPILGFAFLCCLFACSNQDPKADSERFADAIDTMNVIQKKISPKGTIAAAAQKRFIYAPSGLNLRKGPTTDDEKIQTIPYGSEIELLDCPGKAILTIDGLKGKMCKVRFQGQEGYTFTGYLSQFPAPDPEMEVKAFVQKIKEKGLNSEYKKERFDEDGYIQDTEGFQLPTEDWQEAFLIAKTYFGIPDKIKYPSDAVGEETVVKNPDKEEYIWSDELMIHREADGKTIKDIYYYYRGEGGGKTVVIEKAESGGLTILEVLIAD
ncbi:MAG: SH3 domain-containing protein [Bacteroidota bacterium]